MKRKMVGSMDYLDFCIQPITEKNTIPLDCWQSISLSDIWIPSNLLANRNKGCNTGGIQGLYHTLQKKDASKYSESFSVYTDLSFKNEQDIFLSDSDEDIGNTDSINLEIKSLSDNLSIDSGDVAMHVPKLFNHSKENYSENVNNNAPLRRNDNIYSDSKKSNVNNLYDYDEQKNAMLCLKENPEKNYRGVGKDDIVQNTENINFSGCQSSFVWSGELSEQSKDFKNVQSLKKINRDSDSHVSLNKILNEAALPSLKDFACDFQYKKKESDNSDICDKKINCKKSKKEKKWKKLEKSLPLELLFEDMNATQEFNCNKYMNSIIRERERCARIGDDPLSSKEEYPDLMSEKLAFIRSNNTIEAENAERPKYAKIDDDSVCSKGNLYLTPEDWTFIHTDNVGKKENVEFTPTFSFIHSDKETRECPIVTSEILNNLNIEVENDKVEEKSSHFFCGKIVIENIPLDVTKEDISSILCCYGEIKNFSMISTGNSLKVFVEIDFTCDIDWVIECLNGSEPFGTSTGVLKCYQQTE